MRLGRQSLTDRRLRRTRFAAIQRHVLFVVGGLTVGAAAVLLAVAADIAGDGFAVLLRHLPWVPLLLTPAGFAVSSLCARTLFPNSGGSGIPQAIAARQLTSPSARLRLVSLRLALGKALLLLLGLLSGGSIGREGPTVQIGASLMFAVGRLSPRRQPGLILAGASAGVSAAFNTPLAGIVFGIEEMSRSFETRTTAPVLGAVIAAGLTSLIVQGDYTYFGVTHATLRGAQGWLAVPLLGLVGGLGGGGFSRLLVLMTTRSAAVVSPASLWAWVRARPTLFAAICGLVVACCGLLSHGAAFGTGYAQARALVQGEAHTPGLAFAAFKLVATLASSVSAIPGGIFAPSLAVGAGLGADMAAVLPAAPTQALVVLGMVAYFSGVVQAPITAFVIVAEMTGDHAMIVPLMLTALIAFFVSRAVCAEGVYHALARNFRPD